MKTWLVVGVILTAVAVVGAVIALTILTSPPRPRTLPIPAGTVIRITKTLASVPIATFTVAPSGGRLVGAVYMVTGGSLIPSPWPYSLVIHCPLYVGPQTVIFNDTLDPGTYGLWMVCSPQWPATPANPWIINVTQTIEMVYG